MDFAIFRNMLLLFGGLGCFLVGINLLSSCIFKLYGKRLGSLFEGLDGKPLSCLGIGALTTGIIQSSSTTTIMTVNMVDRNIIGQKQATALIIGANLGTTVTAFIISFSALPITELLAVFSFIGFFFSLSSKQTLGKIAELLGSIGILFIGLYVMGNAASFIANLEPVRLALLRIDNPLTILLLSIAVTAVIQSSSAITGVIITLVTVGLVDISLGLYVIIGSNIGSTATALISSFSKSRGAKQAAVIHLLFNLLCAIEALLLLGIPITRSWIFAMLIGNGGTKIALFHFLFNVLGAISVLPFLYIKPKSRRSKRLRLKKAEL